MLAEHAGATEYVIGKLMGKVTDSAGNPIAGAIVMLGRTSGATLDSTKSHKETSDKNGQYEMPIGFLNGKTLVVREVFAEKKGYVRAAPHIEIKLQSGETANLPFTLKEGQVLAGTIQVPLSTADRNMRKKAEEVKRTFQVHGEHVRRHV